MRYYILSVFLCFLYTMPSYCQISDTLSQSSDPEDILSASNKATSIHIDLENTAEVEMLLKKIHSYKYLESIELEGETDEATFKKIIYRLSALKNLSSLSLKDNFLQKVPDNFNTLKSLRSITITGNKELNYHELFTKINQLNITTLELIDNDFKKIPSGISAIKSLKRIKISGSDQVNYEQLMDELSTLPNLTELAIPVNFITELPKNIVKLKSLQVLDVSDNVLTEISDGVSALKSINNLSIQGNLFLNPVKELEKFKGADIRFISMDKEISGDDVEELKKLFPNVEINFPVTDEDDEPDPGPVTTTEENNPFNNKETGTIKAKKDFKILSDAYLFYPSVFQNVIYNFDTLGFNERYADKNYTNIFRRLPSNRAVGGTINITMPMLSVWRGDKKQFSFVLYNDFHRFYPELTAFSGMSWVYQGELSKRKFKKNYIKKTWSDARILFDNNNSVFIIQLKSPESFEKIIAYPVPALYTPKFLDQVQKTYPRRFSNYQKTLTRRAERFDKELRKNKKKYDADYKKIEQFAWSELQSRMSNTEKLMNKEEWLEYYDQIIANEKEALNKSPLSMLYLIRSLTIRNYTNISSATATNSGRKFINVNFTDKNTGAVLPVLNILLVDNKNKSFYRLAGSLGLTPENITPIQFSSNIIIVELRNGNFGVVSSADIDKLPALTSQPVSLPTSVLNKNLDDIGSCLNEALIK